MEVFAVLSILFGLLGTVALIIVGIVFAILKKSGTKKYFLISAACFALMIVGAIVMPTSTETNTTPIGSNNQVTSKEADTKTTEPKQATQEEPVIQGSSQPAKELMTNVGKEEKASSEANTKTENTYDAKLSFPVSKYPETAQHIRDAIHQGESAICTIDRDGADENRDESLDGIPNKDGYDRDEWPMAMCAEGGDGADIEYVTPSDNRGAGSWISNALEDYPDGTKVLFTFSETAATSETKPAATTNETTDKKATTSKPKAVTKETNAPVATPQESTVTTEGADVYYKNCTAVREAGAAPLYEGDPGYSTKLDRDKDGVACE